MAKEALDAVTDDEKKRIEIIPKQYYAEWKRCLGNIQDWCISRQLWWGHQIPAWYVTLEDDKSKEFGAYKDHWVVGRNVEEAQLQANRKFAGKKFQMVQDPDVLDTSFSSGLYPLSVLGWPDNKEDFNSFYPTSVLETGHDFWVARMVMLGMKLGGDVPFKKVYLHPMVRDAHGSKVCKFLGNVFDPLDVINGIFLEGLCRRPEEGNLVQMRCVLTSSPDGREEYGADALRFALVMYTAQSDRINLDIQRVVGYRQWCNKVWNAVHFAMSKLGDSYAPPTSLEVGSMPFSCRWILSVLNKAIYKTVTSLEKYEFSDAATAVYSWWQSQLCDVFIELIKPYFAGADPKFDFERSAARDTLWVCLDSGLKLLHPFMPFVTEELWQRLPKYCASCSKESIMISDYPSVIEEWSNVNLESEMGLVEATVKCLRSLRSELPPDKRQERQPAFAVSFNGEVGNIIKSHVLEISTLASLSSFEVLEISTLASLSSSKLNGALNAKAKVEKLREKMQKLHNQLSTLNQKMHASDYSSKAPEDVRSKDFTKFLKLKREEIVFEGAFDEMKYAFFSFNIGQKGQNATDCACFFQNWAPCNFLKTVVTMISKIHNPS